MLLEQKPIDLGQAHHIKIDHDAPCDILPLCFRQMVGVTDITAILIPGIGYNAMWNNTGIVVCM